MPNNFWKSNERAISKRFNTTRIGAKMGVGMPDFINDWVCGEVFTHDVPTYMTSELAQATRAAGDTKLPIAIMHEKGKKLDDAIVFMKLKDFEANFGK